MKKKYMLAALAFGLSLSAKVMAQVPNYVPTNGLVGWWPFNGNANDESGNGNNGTVNGATLTSDRFGLNNSAYLFTNNGIIQNINTNYIGILGQNSRTISLWYKQDEISTTEQQVICGYGGGGTGTSFAPTTLSGKIGIDVSNIRRHYSLATLSQWNNAVFVYETGNNISDIKIFLNGVLQTSSNLSFGNQSISLNTISGDNFRFNAANLQQMFIGSIDDVGIWNRALSQQEITTLYNSCSSFEITSQPSNANVNLGTTTQFSVNTASGSTYQWQSNPSNFGWQNVPLNASYSGSTTNTLTISNTSVSNHNQPFRAIVNAGGCIDTSIVAQIIIGDTCLTTVTDTLIINTTLGLPAPNNENTILIYPNPANDHITIDNGNYTAMSGYTIKIENNAGQQVFQSLINQAQFYVDLSTWSGDGLYFVHLIDAQGNTVTVRKIVLQ